MPEQIVVDSRGRPCPLPVIDLARAMTTAGPGAVVLVLADDPGASADIPAWCRMRNQDLRSVTDEGDHQVFTVVRTT